MPSAQRTNWCFTIFNYEPIYEALVKLITESYNTGSIVFCCWGKEICPSTQNLHLQGYIQFQDTKTHFNLETKFFKDFPKFYLAPQWARIDAKPAEYCAKENLDFTIGTRRKQGDRSDLNQILDDFAEGKVSVKAIQQADKRFYLQYSKKLNSLKDKELPAVWVKPTVVWYKTDNQHLEFEKRLEQDDTEYYIYQGSWAGYNFQEHVYIYDDGKVNIPSMLHRLSRVSVGFDSKEFRSPFIYVKS